MNRQFTIDLVTDARVFAENAEQVTQDLRRTVATVERVVDDLKGCYEVVSPLVKWVRSALASPPAKAQVVVSTEE
ncbi:hypothetical protein [Streptomyces sp. NPDC006463]|uniref:hypothetical protein n=1 Tax=Streptomyces sp. NPDC006463 TaxID=3364746 RepID=UPI0036B3E157